MDNEILGVVGIGICIFIFLAFLLAIGSFYGGEWEVVAQGVTQVIFLVVAFAYGAYILVKLVSK